MEIKTLSLEAWAKKVLLPTTWRGPSTYSIREEENGDCWVYATAKPDPMGISLSYKQPEERLGKIPDHMMHIHVPYIKMQEISLDGDTFVGDIADILRLESMLEELKGNLGLAVDEISNFLSN